MAVSVFPRTAFAQTCPEMTVVDMYYCDPLPDSFGQCGDVIRDPHYETVGLDCSWSNNSCRSTLGVCSSNDSWHGSGEGFSTFTNL